jgi:hypothetical protein
MIKCSECGYENMDGLDYCDGCGAKLAAASVPAASAPAVGASAVGASAVSAADPGAPAGGGSAVDTHTVVVGGQPAAAKPEAPPPSNGTGAEAATADAGSSAQEPAAAPASASTPAAEAPTGEIKLPPTPPAAAPAMPSMFKARLVIVRGGRKGHEFALEDGNNLVGRWDPDTGAFPEVDLDQDDAEAKISRKHALLRIDDGKITIEDIGSLNGTFVNRQPRLQPGNPIDLKTGDEIIIGKTFLKLVVEPMS